MSIARTFAAWILSIVPLTAMAAEAVTQNQNAVARTGVSGIWILANISYAGMRAQDSANVGWRVVAFIFGLPGTLISFLAIEEGSERAYGIEVPRRRPPDEEA